MPDFFGTGGPDWSGVPVLLGLVFALLLIGVMMSLGDNDK